MSGGWDRLYSTLEVASRQRVYSHDQGKEVVPTNFGKQVVPPEGKLVLPNGNGPEVVTQENVFAEKYGDQNVQILRPGVTSRKKWIIFGGGVGLIVVLVVVLGSVFGLKHKRSVTESSTSPLKSPATSSHTSITIPPTATESSFPSMMQHKIAALSFASDAINNTRVYFQDDLGQIVEAANSADNTTWSIRKTGIFAKNESAIAAAVSRPGFPFAISVFYLAATNLLHEITYTPLTGNWTMGDLPSQGYTAMPNSSLAAMYNQCSRCANTTIVAFQDENGLVQVGNLTSDGWILTQLGSSLDPLSGTGLALQPFYLNGSEDQINLYHQKSDLNMSLASWKPAWKNDGVAGWSLEEQIYNTIPSGSPIAAASSYSNVSTGYETWIEVLSVSDKGVEVSTWSGAKNDWLEQYNNPSAMVNSTGIGRSYGTVAVTAIGSAFGVVKQEGHVASIESWHVRDDTVDWSLSGNVDLGDAWG